MTDWIAFVSTAVGVLALAFGAYQWRHPRRRLVLAYEAATVRYFDEESALPPGANMVFDGREVERLARTTIAVWNDGPDPLRGEDIVDDDPLRVEFADGEVFNSQVAGVANPANRVSLGPVEPGGPAPLSRLALSYDYLNADDGFVLAFIHSSTQEPAIAGSSIGLSRDPQHRRNPAAAGFSTRNAPLRKQEIFNLLLGLGARLVVAMDVVVPIASGYRYEGGPLLSGWLSWMFLATGSLNLSIFGYALWLRRRRHPQSLEQYLAR